METTQKTAQDIFIAKFIKQNDDVFVSNEVIDIASTIGIPTRKGLEKGIVSNGALVNVVSNQYGHLPNQAFFGEVERQLKAANINFVKKSINREDRSFSVDYVLFDENLTVNVKNNNDKILPMLRFVNSYDGSNKTSGHFGFFRQVCSNGLHVAQSQIGFSVKHRGKIVELVMPEISSLVTKFMDNEYYTLANKFETLANTTIKDVNAFVKSVADDLGLFKFDSSETNKEPSLNARLVIDTITKESRILGAEPNLWLAYNAFNELLHDKLKKTFDQQANIDSKIFEHILQLA
jgi:hypothetical protein